MVEQLYPHAKKISVVLDNLNVHTLWTLYERYPAEQARSIAGRLEFHHTPVHASWLNMVEIELSALARQCLARRLPDIDILSREIRRMADRQEHHTAQAGLAIHRQRREDDASQTLPPELTWPSTR